MVYQKKKGVISHSPLQFTSISKIDYMSPRSETWMRP